MEQLRLIQRQNRHSKAVTDEREELSIERRRSLIIEKLDLAAYRVFQARPAAESSRYQARNDDQNSDKTPWIKVGNHLATIRIC